MSLGQSRRLIRAALFLGVVLISQPASAQPGDGLKSSDGGWKVTPALTLTGGYNTNLFRSGGAQEVTPKLDAPLVSVAPGLTITNPGARNFLVDAQAAVKWEQYFGDSVIVDQSGLSAKADLSGTINPKGDLSLTLDENFTRTNFPSSFAGRQTYNWIVNRAGATVGIHPGARILQVDLGYHWWLHKYSTSNLEHLDRDEHRFDASVQWRFLPKTAFLVEGDYGMIRWADSANPGTRPDTDAPTLANSNASPARVQGGLSGLLTRRIALRALAGYGWSMHEVGESFDGVIGTAALAYTFGRLDLKNTLELGYRRDFRNATLGNFYSSHTVFADIDAGLWDRVLSLHLGGRFELRDYSQTIEGAGGVTAGSLNDELLIGLAGLNANIDDWLFFGLEYNIRANFTEDSYSFPSIDGDELNFVREYTQHIITFSTTVQY
jgi:hypothetical protein